MGVTSSLGTLQLDASSGRTVEENQVEGRDVGCDGLAGQRVPVPGHPARLTNLGASRFLVDSPVEGEELVEGRADQAVRRHVWVVGQRRGSICRYEDVAAERLRGRSGLAAVDAAPNDDVLVDLDVEELQGRSARVLETAGENGRRELDRSVGSHVDGERQEREVAREKH